MSEPPKVEEHQKAEVDQHLAALRAVAPTIAATMAMTVNSVGVADDAPAEGGKIIYFIRHGEGFHNVAQREWRADPSWDGSVATPTEPYTIDNDPNYKFMDAELTPKGISEAEQLQARVALMKEGIPELMVVSPLRRSTQTGLIAFNARVESGALKTVAHELCHEQGGRHTCDKRLSRTALQAGFPAVDYSMLADEEDPLWADGVTRESMLDIAQRGALFAAWLQDRPETHIAVAAHSAFLLTLFNAVLKTSTEEEATWFGTGEMRTVRLTFVEKK
jgi:broad specificity phosphatase PhoE